ncbi:hypothetical protein NK8_72900 (plasmid) [Caballeronia sp. NK8]|uniref:hypothetical protein n=1 Tax=Caballeronia sp. NK8 TaxID=140098 RepID=UPI001BB714BA|nr:hypothetical protein [Caballeronia sp. NK8]BCQ29100.1 hypothetical protein NK8_72900 [Caballeronia sp. NK8]
MVDERGRLYVSSVEHHAISVRDGERFTTILRDKRLVWPDTFSEGGWHDLRHRLADSRHELVQPAKPYRVTDAALCDQGTLQVAVFVS